MHIEIQMSNKALILAIMNVQTLKQEKRKLCRDIIAHT